MQPFQVSVKRIVFSLLALFAFGYTLPAQTISFQEIPFEEALSLAKKTGKIIMVDVRGAQKPSANEKVENEIFTADSIAAFLQEHCIPVYVNMHSDAGKAFAPRLNMLMYPTYVFYDGQGVQLDYINAYTIANDPAIFMQKARASLAQAKERVDNSRSIIFTEKKWADLLEQAKRENKLIFLDAQTEWCRPCRLMAQNIFTLNRVADFYNSNFINVTMDMEKGEGPALAKKYKITAYPTYLFIDHTGNLVHMDDGYKEAEPFIEVGKKALEAKKQQQ